MKVLILSGRFGFGHKMAANAVREELERQDKNIEIVQKDLPEYFYPHISKLIYKVFGLVAERCHGIYNLIYKISGRMNSGTRPGGPLIYRKFQKMMEEYMPDVIVCTHPFCMKAAATYKAKSDSRIPLVTCITDISMHKEWYAKQTDLYLAPTKEVKDNLVSLGAAPENVMVTGVPVRQQFLKDADSDNHAYRADLYERDIDHGYEKHVLIMGGGLGIMPGLEKLLYTLHEMMGVHTTVITGKNQRLYEMWEGRFDDVEMKGYVENIGKYMRNADLVITKAGGITLFELLHSKVPMFIIRPFLEQETVNARYAEKKGFARVVWDSKEDFIGGLRALLNDPGQLEEMKACMHKAKCEMIDCELSQAVWAIIERGFEYLSAFEFVSSERSLFGKELPQLPVCSGWCETGISKAAV